MTVACTGCGHEDRDAEAFCSNCGMGLARAALSPVDIPPLPSPHDPSLFQIVQVTYRGGWVALFSGENQTKAMHRSISQLNQQGYRVTAAVDDHWSFWHRVGTSLLWLITLGFVGKGENVLLFIEFHPLAAANDMATVHHTRGWIRAFSGANQLREMGRVLPQLTANRQRVIAAVDDQWSFFKSLGATLVLLLTLGFWGPAPNTMLITEPFQG